ncbi:MAG: GntG family PLP-dependent aldolase [Ginsengibacter sp.]
MIEYRSDTFTKPTAGMLQAMSEAEVGDDVYNEDPTVNKLQSMLAEKFGMDAGIFCPSGTMTNQISIKCHTQPGGEIICDKFSHVYIYEGGGIAFNSGCQVKTLEGDHGRIVAAQVIEAINPVDIHKAKTQVVSLENTANRGGGSCYNFADIQEIKEVCLENNLKLHLDGARLFNAIVAKDEDPKEYGHIFDSISICLSKGLGAPIGSVLLGDHNFIEKARRVRKVFGGGMRQAGYMAAAGIYAIENNIDRLALDHRHAKQIEEALLQKEFIGKIMPVETNIIIFEIKNNYTANTLAEAFKKNNILVSAISSTQIRMVLHLDVSEEMVKETIEVIRNL